MGTNPPYIEEQLWAIDDAMRATESDLYKISNLETATGFGDYQRHLQRRLEGLKHASRTLRSVRQLRHALAEPLEEQRRSVQERV